MRVSQWLLILWVKAEASDGGSNASGAGGASMRVEAVTRHHRWLHHHPVAPRPPPEIYIYICIFIYMCEHSMCIFGGGDGGGTQW